MAAYIIGYAPNKMRVANDPQYALQDPDDYSLQTTPCAALPLRRPRC